MIVSAMRERMADDFKEENMVAYIANQQWPAIQLRKIDGKGTGVFAIRPIPKGQTVLDYHGQLLTAAQGETIMKTGHESRTMYSFSRELTG